MPNSRYITTGVTSGLEWVYASAAKARGIVFAPPLIGGHALQQLRELRHLLYHQFSLFTFNYAGHGHSEGSFCLRTSLINTQQMIDLALEHGARRKLPLFGVASCFAAMPLLKAATVNTIMTHRYKIRSKLGIKNQTKNLQVFLKQFPRQ